MRELRPDFQRVFKILNEHNVRYVIVGGVAMSLNGISYFTDDVDVCYGRDTNNLDALVGALAPYHPRLRGPLEAVPFLWDARTLKNGLNFTLTTDVGSVDLLGEAPGAPPFETLWGRAAALELRGNPVKFAAVEDLIAMKMAANRVKDQPHLVLLRELQRAREKDGGQV